MADIKITLQEHQWLATWGYIESRETYLALSSQCDVVLSSAIHDFQGLSVLEGMASGCIRLVPNRLVYPEYVTADLLYESHIDAPSPEAACAAEKLQAWRESLLVASGAAVESSADLEGVVTTFLSLR